jgi:hypothetical protein
MSEIEEIQETFAALSLIAKLYARTEERREELREEGYAEYDKPRNRFVRFWRRKFRLPYLKRESWNTLIDKIVDE